MFGCHFKICMETHFCQTSMALAESCFELLFKLLSHSRVGGVFLEVAESRHSSFFIKLLKNNLLCTSTLPLVTMRQEEIQTCYLNQRAWILRAISFEV